MVYELLYQTYYIRVISLWLGHLKTDFVNFHYQYSTSTKFSQGKSEQIKFIDYEETSKSKGLREDIRDLLGKIWVTRGFCSNLSYL